MGDLNRGETFADGETVTAARLHKLVDEATIKAGTVTTVMLADGAVTPDKMSGSTFAVSALQIPSGNVIIGNGSNVGSVQSLDTDTMQGTSGFGVKDAGIGPTQLATDAVETAKIANGAVTSAKLATLSPSPAGSVGSSTQVPVLTINDKGQVTAASTASISGATVAKYTPELEAIPAENGAYHQFAHGAPSTPAMVSLFFECVSTTDGYSIGDRIPIWAVVIGGFGVDWPVFSFTFNNANIRVIRHMGSGNSFYYDKESTNDVPFPTNNWRIRAIVWV